MLGYVRGTMCICGVFMPRPRKSTEMLRFAIPIEMHERFQRLAEVMGIDTPMAVRVLAGIGLAQMEGVLVKGEAPAAAVAAAPAVVELVPQSSRELVKVEPEPDAKHFRGLRPGPRSEVDELPQFEVIGSPLDAPDGPAWSYMRGL